MKSSVRSFCSRNFDQVNRRPERVGCSSSRMTSQIAAIFTLHESNWVEVQAFKRPLQCCGSWGRFRKCNAAFLATRGLVWSAAHVSSWTDAGLGDEQDQPLLHLREAEPSSAGLEFHRLPISKKWAAWETLCFFDSTARLSKIRYQRTAQERNHKDQLFLNTFDIDGSHSFPP